MIYNAINIQGSIISGEILEKVRTEDIKFQSPADFKLTGNTSIRDEIGIAWAATRAHWQAFRLRKERLAEQDTGTSETRQSWMIPFLRELGYELEKSTAEFINNKSYPVSHRAVNNNGFPVHIVGINQSLDQRAESGGTRLSPHALIQEYLNNHDHLYALVSNGKFLRLLRDATRLSRLSYLEFNLEQIMEEDLFSEFALLFRLLHVTRMPQSMDSGEESIFEFYHQEGLASGSRIREKLSKAVGESLLLLANGLLKHPSNQELSDGIKDKTLTPPVFYLRLLRLVYRMLFLLVIEERRLIYPQKLDEITAKKKDIYYRYYSISRLAKLAEKQIYVDSRKTDLWQSLITLFLLFENGKFSEKLGIKPLGSGLFAPDALGSIINMSLDNKTLLEVLILLISFENENKQRVHVNYADLDVEEFGSVYEGLLEIAPDFHETSDSYVFAFSKGSERSSSGSHYTPEELVKPLLQHSLEHLINDCIDKPLERLGIQKPEKNITKHHLQEKALLSLKVLDDACGSGHILLSAARRIGLELARVRESYDSKNEVEQPSPPYIRLATRDAIRHCIYGVDLNPLAVELCKVALWLEAHNPGEPLNFLDHHIRCGNAIVGLAHKEELKNGIATEAFKTLPGDDKGIAQEFAKRNKQERNKKDQISLNFEQIVEEPLEEVLEKWEQIILMPETTPADIEAKQLAYDRFTAGTKLWRLKNIADIQVAQFFIPKTSETKKYLVTDSPYRQYLSGQKPLQDVASALAGAVSQNKRFFHWFLEFPEVFAKGGFDCIVGNPPFLGDRKLKEAYGNNFLEWIRSRFTDGGTVDLVVYFFLRNASIASSNGFLSLIATNTIAQGKARELGLEKIIQKGYSINHAVKGMKWPGLAAVEVSIVSIFNGIWYSKLILNGKQTQNISAFLDEADNTGTPFPLQANEGKSFQGSIVLGTGFIVEVESFNKLILNNPEYKEVLYPYINGDDLNNNPDQNHSRYVINFHDWSEEKAKQFHEIYDIICKKVKPERQRFKEDKNGNPIHGVYALRMPLPVKWWQHAEKRPALYKAIKDKKIILLSCRVSKYVNQSFIEVEKIFDVATSVVARSEYWEYAFLQNTLHQTWAWKYASTLESRIRYVNVDCIDTFPILKDINPFTKINLDNIGETYHAHRKQLMFNIQLGLTKTYNLFHSSKLSQATPSDLELDDKTFEKKFGKDALLLRKHLAKTEDTISFNEAVSGIIKLRQLHIEMDTAVLDAYGWTDVKLRHDFYELDYLPENDRIRFTIHPDASRELLKRLLELNHKIHEQEVQQGLFEKTKSTSGKVRTKKSETNPEPDEGSLNLFT